MKKALTIINGTNRPENVTGRIVATYSGLANEYFDQVKVLNCQNLPKDFSFNNQVMGEGNNALDLLITEYIEPATHLSIISPEYNGSFPGVLKSFIDSALPMHWAGKKTALVGVASGRAGNLRGMDHLTNILHYLKAHVHPTKIPISSVSEWVDENGVVDDIHLELLRQQIEDLSEF